MGPDYSPPRPQEPPFVPILSQMSSVQASTPYSSKTHVRIIPHIDLCSPIGFFHWGLPIRTVHAFPYSPMHATWHSDLNLLVSYHRTYAICFVTSRNREASQLPVCFSCMLFPPSQVLIQGGSNMTGTHLYVNKPHCAAAVRPWESEATTSTLPPARVRTCSVLSGSC